MLSLSLPYVRDPLTYCRRRTREVMVGQVGVGADNPIRVQSMTTTLTKDIVATVDQAERLVRAGCEIVRITTPTPADARCLGPIKEKLAARGINVPIVADIHFNPLAALTAAEYADKVRINPGNYADSRKFAVREYTDAQYQQELERIEERFTPLVQLCRRRRVAMRIGTNHGSLSDRIMNRFGDTPEGMVESALEFVRICEKNQYFDVILSMKASNPKVMIAAYRLLAARMAEEEMDYPFHLGVTEAGNGEDGRIKSAIGIGSLLEDGIGDTIRVSLTEEPEAEIPVAYALAGRYDDRRADGPNPATSIDLPWDPYHYSRRVSREISLGPASLGGEKSVSVVVALDGPPAQRRTSMAEMLRWASPAGRRQPKPDAAWVPLVDHDDVSILARIAQRLREWPGASLGIIGAGDDLAVLMDSLPYVDAVSTCAREGAEVTMLASAARDAGAGVILEMDSASGDIDVLLQALSDVDAAGAQVGVSLRGTDTDLIHTGRLFAARAAAIALDVPVLLHVQAAAEPLLPASIALGSLLCDGVGDAVLISGTEAAVPLAFNILQAAGARIFKTDYVACPSCGRTLFDLQETTERIKQRTNHLVGVKIAVMGCIVNGPGEMADADFGYVGGAPGQVNLYVGKACVEKGVAAEHADDRLVDLIKSHGKWQEPELEA